MRKRILLPLLLLAFGCQQDVVVTPGHSSIGAMYSESGFWRGGSLPAVSYGDRYNDFQENPFVSVADAPVSTFSIDADGGSYANVRRFISEGQLPPTEAIRTERSEEHTSELQSRENLVCRLLLEKKKKYR